MNPADRKRKRWQQDLPAFLDAASSVSSTTFGARRLPELKALWRQVPLKPGERIDEALQSAGHKTSTRHLRRRTRSHVSRKRHRYPTGKADNGTVSEISSKPNTSRKSRRKPSMLRKNHSGWQRQGEGESIKPHWLPTHLWHAKRFHMCDMFGWRVPSHHTNRGYRAIERLLREGRTLLQDITWRMQPIVVGTNDLMSLIGCLSRLCADFLPKNRVQAVLEGKCFGEGILHEPDAFPTKAIGPAMWWIRQTTLKNCTTHEINLFLHPSIKSRVEEVLGQLIATTLSSECATQVDGGIACFQLRGQSASDTIAETLKLSGDHLKAFESASHLAVVPVVKSLDSQPLLSTSKNPFALGIGELILIRHEQALDRSSGWDLFCSVADAHDIFLALVHHALIVPMGYVDDYHLRLSSDPPLPIFPAAFPDSEQGKMYWVGSEEWKLVRSLCEGGHGRIKIPHNGNAKLSMRKLENLASPSDEFEDFKSIQPVVVRGVFGQPFVDLLQQCARHREIPSSEQTKSRNPKRKQVSPVAIRLACRISGDEARARRQQVSSLAKSLSLAALILCKIQVYGRGRLGQDDSIYGCSEEKGQIAPDLSSPLGVAVEGSFSDENGLVQGTGFVGASRLLTFLESCSHPAMVDKDGTLFLVVVMRQAIGDRTCKGILSLLL
jgi:hypothetical protein